LLAETSDLLPDTLHNPKWFLILLRIYITTAYNLLISIFVHVKVADAHLKVDVMHGYALI